MGPERYALLAGCDFTLLPSRPWQPQMLGQARWQSRLLRSCALLSGGSLVDLFRWRQAWGVGSGAVSLLDLKPVVWDLVRTLTGDGRCRP